MVVINVALYGNCLAVLTQMKFPNAANNLT
ncbi:hypothetical protein SASC598O02_012410 [Snodgrassella alvi SCGC AB-598-O02]|nr:hypothetical protein SASC598O02_012410 [Snodgrassella alvi SCGC AB-598-O02]